MLWIHVLCAAVFPAALAQAECLWQDSSGPLDDKASHACGSGDAAGWQGPESCAGDSCLYWNTQYNNGQGLALVTKGEHSMEAATYAEAAADGPSPISPEDPPFRVAEVPGKGRGLVATRLIRKGDVVLAVRPILAVDLDAYHALPEAQARALYGRALEKLSAAAREGFMSQAGDDVLAKLARNAFTLWIGPGGKHMAVYPQAALINHDCRPSTTYRLSNLTHITTAVRDIQPDEEISLSYIDLMQPRARRQARLREWGFDCRCKQCSLPAGAAAASDANVARIRELTDALDGPDGAVTADTGRELVALHERERLDLYLGAACTRAALNYGMFGMRNEAVEYAEQAVEALTRQLGPGAADIPSLRALVEDPTGHWTWGLRTRRGKGKGQEEARIEGTAKNEL
ncbi:hypothetical protein RB595_008792 [Gaeumannomyces hyphopodioides]